MKWIDAVNECKRTNLTGWDLVEYVRDYIHRHMQYSVDIPMKSHRKAFEAGKGYCVQQAFCVCEILQELKIEAYTVYCRKAYFPSKNLTSGHTWCRVIIDGEERDVCSCETNDGTGTINFVVESPIRKYKGIVVIAGYLGSISVCMKRRLTRKKK